MVKEQAGNKLGRSVVSDGSELPASHLGAFASPGARASGTNETPTICGDMIEAARTESQQLAGKSPAPSREGLLRIEAMLGVISYCYVKGIFDSGEIERRLWCDAAFLATFGDEMPTARKIRHFRRQHRAGILSTIERALLSFQQRSDEPEPATLQRLPGTIHDRAEHLLDMANIIDQLGPDS